MHCWKSKKQLKVTVSIFYGDRNATEISFLFHPPINRLFAGGVLYIVLMCCLTSLMMGAILYSSSVMGEVWKNGLGRLHVYRVKFSNSSKPLRYSFFGIAVLQTFLYNILM